MVEEAEGRAKVIVTEAGKQAEAQISDAQTQSHEIVGQAEEQGRQAIDAGRAEALQETTELKRQALQEIRTVMTHVQEMSAAASEELETQRILTNVAEIRASTKRVIEEATDFAPDDWPTTPAEVEETPVSPTPSNGAELSESLEEVGGPPQDQDQSEAVKRPRSAKPRAKARKQ